MPEIKKKKLKPLKSPLKARLLLRVDIPKSPQQDFSAQSVSKALGRQVQHFGIVPGCAAYYTLKEWRRGDPAKLREGGYFAIRALCTLPANTRGIETDCGRFAPIGTKLCFRITLNTGRYFTVTMTKTFLTLGPHEQLIEELALLGYERSVVETMIRCIVEILQRETDNLKANGEINLVRLGHLDASGLKRLFEKMTEGSAIITGVVPKGDSFSDGRTRSKTESARSSFKVAHKSRSGKKNTNE